MSKADFARKYGSQMANAEIQLIAELNRRGIYGFITQYAFSFDPQVDLVHGTTVDFYFPKHKLCVFLDGVPHLKLRQEIRDERVTKALTRRGIKVIRIEYEVPITERKIKESVDFIEKELNRNEREG